MNVHDSERLSGLLEDAGYAAATGGRAGRRRRVQHLRGARERRQQALRQPRPPRAGQGANPGMQIAVGGCLAQKDRDTITERAPWVDVVFGTHNIGSLPVLLERARVQEEAQVEILESLEVFPSTLPTKRESAYAAWVSISVGLQQHLHVLHRPGAARQGEGPPARRRPRRDRGAGRRGRQRGDPARPERQRLRRRVRRPAGVLQAAARLRRDRGARAGAVHRPHPAEFTDDVIEAMAETPNVMPQLHMPLQSGSDRVLQGDAPLLPAGEVPRHHRAGPRRDARRRDHHRHHRRLPRRDRGGLPGDDGRRAPGAVRRRLHLPVLQASRHPGRRPWTTRCRRTWCRTATTGWSTLVNDIAWEENKRLVGRRSS